MLPRTSSLRRKTPLGWQPRRQELSPRGAKLRAVRLRRAAERTRKRVAEVNGCEYGAFLEAWFDLHGCPLCGRTFGPVHRHHTKTRGAQGTAEHQVPLCAWCHWEGHTKGFAGLEARAGLSLAQLAIDLAAAGALAGYLPVEVCGLCGTWHSTKLLIDLREDGGRVSRVCLNCVPEGPA